MDEIERAKALYESYAEKFNETRITTVLTWEQLGPTLQSQWVEVLRTKERKRPQLEADMHEQEIEDGDEDTRL